MDKQHKHSRSILVAVMTGSIIAPIDGSIMTIAMLNLLVF